MRVFCFVAKLARKFSFSASLKLMAMVGIPYTIYISSVFVGVDIVCDHRNQVRNKLVT